MRPGLSGAAFGLASVCVLALAPGLHDAASAAVISATPDAALSAVPVDVAFGGRAAVYAFTAASTGDGPGASVATAGTAEVSSLFGGVADFSADSTIDGGPLNGFARFAAPAVVPFSAADDFIGLAFRLADGLHYGYAELAGADLVSYGYEQAPGIGIATGATSVPEPASAAVLAAGVVGVAVLGRRRRHASSLGPAA